MDPGMCEERKVVTALFAAVVARRGLLRCSILRMRARFSVKPFGG
jgi:hypothetical protein